MNDHSILKVRLQQERHVVHARQRARDIAERLGFDKQDQVRIATATSELARNAFRYAHEGAVTFAVSNFSPQTLTIEVCDAGPGIPHLDEVLSGRYQSRTGMGKGLVGTQRLMDTFEIHSTMQGTQVRTGKVLPSSAGVLSGEAVRALAVELAKAEVDPFQEIERQNQELLSTLAELNEKQQQLAQVNSELEDTNRGVVALYAELEQNADDLRRVSNQKTSFLSNLSHEFRTPLNAILALCQILHNRSDGDLTAEQEKQVDYIRSSAADLSDLVNDLLDVAKVEAGKVDVKPTVFSVVDLFGALRGMLRTLLTSTAVQLNFADAGALPVLFTDEQKLSQILRNLVSNALKFTERGHVHVSAEMQGDHVVFRVEDTGIGVASADHERIFEEFVQISGKIQNRVRGTGLGLPLSRKLAELLGGSLQVESEPGVGSIFSLILPAQYEVQEPVPATAGIPKLNTLKVLIVEDNMETRFIHHAALKNSPYNLLFCRSITEARAIVDADVPAAIVLDRMLHGKDSLRFLEDLRGEGYRGKVIVVSVMDDPEAARQAGADAFLPKPVAHGLLTETLMNLLGDKQAKSLLLVDDDEINRYVLREALTFFHFDISEARSGREAIEVATQKQVGGIFLDLTMPGFTGLETLRELRASPSTNHIPVIIHTSKELTDSERVSLEALGADFLPKKILSEPHAQESLRVVLTKAGLL